MDMSIQLQRRAEALRKTDSSGMRVLEAKLGGFRAIVAHHLVGKETHQPVERADVAGEEEPELERCRKNPLANRDGGKDVVDASCS